MSALTSYRLSTDTQLCCPGSANVLCALITIIIILKVINRIIILINMQMKQGRRGQLANDQLSAFSWHPDLTMPPSKSSLYTFVQNSSRPPSYMFRCMWMCCVHLICSKSWSSLSPSMYTPLELWQMMTCGNCSNNIYHPFSLFFAALRSQQACKII